MINESPSTAMEFESKGYLHIPKALTQEVCGKFVDALQEYVDRGICTLDVQCPLSPAVYGHPAFEALLEEMMPHIELTLGKKLYPTYSYARMYRKGDELKPHVDRPACEISATLTLGFDSKVWPFFVADDLARTNTVRIDAAQGDVILYQGTQKAHWRDKFEGEWQAQVFLHYVDADGENASCKFDGREALGHRVIKEEDILYWSFEDALTEDECDKIVRESKEAGFKSATIGTGQHVDKSYRDTKRLELPPYKGIGALLTGAALSANSQAWAFDVTHADQCEVLEYDIDGHYDVHIDTFVFPGRICRKLTAIAILNDEHEGGRFYIKTGREKLYPPQKKGGVIVFPSFLQHGVEPVTSGARYSAVCWMVGPFFK